MKRFHLHVGVKDLDQSVRFYSSLFGQEPTKLKTDYAKWMLEDPRINFAISTRVGEQGVDHAGFQVDSDEELSEITERLKSANLGVFDEGETTCCYAQSNKAWTLDPSGLAWETYRNMGDAQVYHEEKAALSKSECCVPSAAEKSCCG